MSTERERSERESRRRVQEIQDSFTLEQDFFVWYHHIDLGQSWSEIIAKFEAEFPYHAPMYQIHLQRSFLRTSSRHNIKWPWRRPTVKAGLDAVELYGMVAKTGIWFPWMGEV